MSFPEKFRPDEDEQLIELVHANPCLWNMADPDFKKEKRFVWEDIGKRLTRRKGGRSGVECKSRWRSIRDYYKKQKKDEKNGEPAVKRRQVYWNSLKFLDDVDDELKALTNVHVEISEDIEDMEMIAYQEYESDICETSRGNWPLKRRKLKEEEREDEFEERITELKEYYVNTEEHPDFGPGLLECKLKENMKQFGDHRITQDYENKSNISEQDKIDDEIELFFKAMAATVKKFPAKLKVECKAKIFTVVNGLELRHLESSNRCQNVMGSQAE